jgi:hypothetical protein
LSQRCELRRRREELVEPGCGARHDQRQPGGGIGDPRYFVLWGVACAGVTSCEAVGQTSSSDQGVVMPITNGVPGTAYVVSGTTVLSGVACPSDTACVVVGANGWTSDITSGSVAGLRERATR